MPPDFIAILRIAALVAAVVQILLGTVLWGFVWRRIVQPWVVLVERSGVPLPAALRSSAGMRAITLVFTLPALVMWWLLGTSAVRDALSAGITQP